MANEENWRTPTDALDYFGGQSKKLGVADRRPVIRKAADLVGPGITAQAVPITDFEDLLATYNGYYSAVAGAKHAPVSDESFVGTVVMDSTMGGVQRFTSMKTKIDYKRVFQRNASAADSIFFGAWQQASNEVPIGALMPFGGRVAPNGWLVCNGVSYATTLYPDLFAVTGYSFGGSGLSFNVPDLRDRSVYGSGTAWAVGTTDGLAVGSRSINLFHTHSSIVTNSAPAHQHSISGEPAHTHYISPASMNTASNTGTGGSADRLTTGSTHNHLGDTGAGGYHSHGGWVASGGDHSHTGSTVDNSGDGPRLRGVGLQWIIKHGAA